MWEELLLLPYMPPSEAMADDHRDDPTHREQGVRDGDNAGKTITCFNCGEPGHKAPRCPRKQPPPMFKDLTKDSIPFNYKTLPCKYYFERGSCNRVCIRLFFCRTRAHPEALPVR